MQRVISIRLDDKDLEFVKKSAKERKVEKAKILREVIEKGRLYLAIEQYRQGKISLGKAAEIANRSIGEFIDLLAELGVKNPMTKQQYLQGLKNLGKIWK